MAAKATDEVAESVDVKVSGKALAAKAAGKAGKVVDKAEFNRLDIARSKQAVGGEDWIAFTSAEAPWIPLSVNLGIVNIFSERDELVRRQDHDGTEDWLARAGGVLHEFIVQHFVVNEARPAQFRALGRGWIFIQLSANHLNMSKSSKSNYGAYDRKYTRFKWWFEGIERILLNRSDELPDMGIKTAEQLSRWTSGYVHGAELVFVLRGIYPKMQLMSCKKWRTDYRNIDVLGTSEDLRKALAAPVLTDSEREAHAKNVHAAAMRRRAKRERQKAKKAEAAAEERQKVAADAAATEREEGLKASQAFEELLEEMRQQDLQSEDGR